MKVMLLGYREMSGTSKKSGRPYSGVSLYFSHDDPQVMGQKTDNCFAANDVLLGVTLTPGNDYDIDFNRQGFVVAVQPSRKGGK